MMLFNNDDEPVTKEDCMDQAMGHIDRATYGGNGELDRIASSQLAIAWMMLADRVAEREKPVHLG